MTANTGRVHNAQASLPWTKEEISHARSLAEMEKAPVRLIRELFPNRNLTAVKARIYSIRSGRDNYRRGVQLGSFFALDPDDPGVEDKDFDRFADDAKRGSDKLLSALERAGLVPA